MICLCSVKSVPIEFTRREWITPLKTKQFFIQKKEDQMKAFLGKFLAGATFALTFLAGCKKETTAGGAPDQQGTVAAAAAHAPDVIVHAGSSIQAAINTANAGSIIQIEPGTYSEAIVINKPGIQLIASGDGVVIQNPGDEENGITVTDHGDGFVLKNVTVQNFEENGVLLIRVDNFLISHLTAINDGEYGLFPLFCTNGVVEHCTATGHTDTGIYVGQSSNVQMNFNIAYGNVNGLEIENCTNVTASKNQSYDNVAGMLIVLLPGLTTKTSSTIIISHNHVYNNNHVNFSEPGGGFENFVPSGSGILVVGTDQTTVEDNNVSGNNFVGIATVSTLILGSLAGIPPAAFADIEPNPDGARIVSNVLNNNGSSPPPGIPLPGVDLLWDGSGTNNCWKGNIYSQSYPSTLPSCN
jgi:parallel beta-helix repeat protein